MTTDSTTGNMTESSLGANTERHALKSLEAVVERSLDEQQKARRWSNFFKILTFAYVTVFLLMLLFRLFQGDSAFGGTDSHVGVVEIKGVIASEELANANDVAGGLRRAFENDNCQAILLAINSPGGSPVQSGQIYDEIKRLRGLHPEKKVYAAISELGASGAYYIAAAADEIYADKASLVGSIGVVGSSFGFVEAMEKLGVERRQYTAGEHKGFLDPFLPQNPKETDFWQGVLKITHDQFVSVVREGRGDRLNETPDMFSGLIWSGEQALEMGLVDGLGSGGFVAREIVGEENLVDYTIKPDPLQQALGRLGVSIGRGIASASVEQRFPKLQ